jgi:putative DNA primase/helicase
MPKSTIIGSVIILANEDDAAHTIRPRLDAAGADTNKVYIVEGVAREGQQVDLFQLDTDIAALRMRAEEIGDVRLIIIDPPSAYLGPKVDAYKESDVRRVLAPLTQLAHDTRALVLLVVHLNKRSDGGAQQRFGGSTAWIAAPRAAFLVAEEEATRRRFMLPVKNNLGNDRLGFEYRVAETILNYRSGPIKAPFIEWLGSSNRSTTDLLNPPKPKDTSALDEAKEFLRNQLAGGAKTVADVKVAATDAGISDATLNRAKTDLGVKSTKVENVWNWALRSIFND